MRINRPALKAEARSCMRDSKTSPYIMALVYFIVSFIISELMGRLLFPSDLVYYYVDYENMRVGFYVSPEYFGRILREPLAYLLALLLDLAQQMLAVGVIIFCLNAARRAAASMWNLVDGFAQILRVIALYIVEGVFVFLWSLLFIIPGIVAAYRYRLAIYLLLDRREMGVMDCIRESKRLMNGRKGELFVLDLSFIGWNLLTIIPFASVFVTPYTQTTYACYYLAVSAADAYRGKRPGPDMRRGKQREPSEG